MNCARIRSGDRQVKPLARVRPALLALLCGVVSLGVASPSGAPRQAEESAPWVMPRTSHGHPDLQGNWTNATITRIQRAEGQEAVLSPEQVAEIEGTREALRDRRAQPSDPDREAPRVARKHRGSHRRHRVRESAPKLGRVPRHYGTEGIPRHGPRHSVVGGLVAGTAGTADYQRDGSSSPCGYRRILRPVRSTA